MFMHVEMHVFTCIELEKMSLVRRQSFTQSILRFLVEQLDKLGCANDTSTVMQTWHHTLFSSKILDIML